MLNETSTVQDLLDEIQVAKEKLIKQKKIKKIRNLPDISDKEELFKIPKNWKWMRLGEVIQIINGDRGKNYPSKKELKETGNIPFISALNIKNNTISNEHLLYVDKERYDVLRSGKLSKGDIVLCIRGSLGKNGRYPYECGAIASSLVIIRSYLNVDGIYRYISLYLNSILFQKELSKYDNGTAQPNLGAKDLALFAVPVPPLSEQQRLVARIESLFAKLDAAKAKVQAVLDAHEKRKAALLHEAIAGNLIGAGERELKPLSEIVDLIRIGPFGSALHKEDYIQDGIPVVNPQHIVNQVICPDSRKSISESKADSLAVYKMCVNDIIIGRRGEMGRTAPVGEDEAGWLCGTGCMLLRLKKEYDAKFYSLVIASQKSKQYLETHAVGSTMKNLNEKIIRNLPVPVYSYAEQQEIVAVLDRLLGREEEVRQLAESVLAAIDGMKQSILARAFRGELGA